MTRAPDEPGDLVQRLRSLGLTKYEALVYIALLRVPGATASGIHDASSVPRASVYPVLDQLLAKDLVSVSQSAPKRFAAIPPETAIARLLGAIERDAEDAKKGLLAIHRRREWAGESGGELIWNLYGARAIRRRLAGLIAGAEKEVAIIALPVLFSPEVREALVSACPRIRCEIITPSWEGDRPGNLKIRIRARKDLMGGQGRGPDPVAGGICIVDRNKVLVVIGSGESDMAALFSASEGFVRFFLRYYALIARPSKKKTAP